MRLRPDSPPELFAKADALGLLVSCVGGVAGFSAPAFAAVLESHPGLPVIIEHLGGINSSANAATAALHPAVMALSRFPNAYIKIHGLGECCRRVMPVSGAFPFERDGIPLLHAACDAFKGRVVWGSDYPHVESSHPYTREHLRISFAGVPEAEIQQMLALNAAEVYGFDLEKLAPVAARIGPSKAEIAEPLAYSDLPERARKCPAFADDMRLETGP